jgi:hypothetical protein
LASQFNLTEVDGFSRGNVELLGNRHPTSPMVESVNLVAVAAHRQIGQLESALGTGLCGERALLRTRAGWRRPKSSSAE